jgi:hypothetical protein
MEKKMDGWQRKWVQEVCYPTITPVSKYMDKKKHTVMDGVSVEPSSNHSSTLPFFPLK